MTFGRDVYHVLDRKGIEFFQCHFLFLLCVFSHRDSPAALRYIRSALVLIASSAMHPKINVDARNKAMLAFALFML